MHAAAETDCVMAALQPNHVLLTNVHEGLSPPCEDYEDITMVAGDYDYYHYGCDKFDDRGWGCGYRTLQTMCSWIQHQRLHDALPVTTPSAAAIESAKDNNDTILSATNISSTATVSTAIQSTETLSETNNTHALPVHTVPTLPMIQQALVTMGDKPNTFLGSKNWIGSFEVCITIDYFYNVPCKIIHINSGNELASKIPDLIQHFKEFGSPIMMGGDSDASSKGIMGVCTGSRQSYLLVLDPHFWGRPTISIVHNEKWLSWKPVDSFSEDSFYNLCMPQCKAR